MFLTSTRKRLRASGEPLIHASFCISFYKASHRIPLGNYFHVFDNLVWDNNLGEPINHWLQGNTQRFVIVIPILFCLQSARLLQPPKTWSPCAVLLHRNLSLHFGSLEAHTSLSALTCYYIHPGLKWGLATCFILKKLQIYTSFFSTFGYIKPLEIYWWSVLH